VLRHLRDVVEHDFVGVALHVAALLLLVEGNGAHDSRVGVLEGGVPSKLGSLFLVLVFFSHFLPRRPDSA